MSDDTDLRTALQAALCRAILGVPPRVVALIAKESDPLKVREILRDALAPAVAIASRLDELER